MSMDEEDQEDEAHEAEVAAAEAAVDAAYAALDEAQQERDACAEALEEAKRAREKAESDLQAVQEMMRQLETEGGEAREVQERRYLELQGVYQEAQSRLGKAVAALEGYLAQHPPAAAYQAWRSWRPTSGGVVKPDQLRDRFQMDRGVLREFIRDMSCRDRAYHDMLQRLRVRYAEARGPVERKWVADHARGFFSGRTNELLAEEGLRPLANHLEHQHRVTLQDGGVTVVDLVLRDMNQAVIFGRGPGRSVQAGQDLGAEMKAYRTGNYMQELDHLTRQVGGHRELDASVVLCSRDIAELPAEKQRQFRDAVAAEGSFVLGILPKKEELDAACLAAIQEKEDGE